MHMPNQFWLNLSFLIKATKMYFANHVIAHVPSFRIRHWYYRNILKYVLGRDSSIHMNTFVTGDHLSIGDNVVINRKCYIDGRFGVEINNNISISSEVCILSMDHDPNHPQFATRQSKVIIKDNVWVGIRAIILPGVTLGEGCVVAANSVVTKDVEPYKIVAGIPAKVIKDRNREIAYKCRYFPWFDTDVQRSLDY
jgi:acetyltransferase-like isoleucine patch superfamily enzyme